MQKHIDSGIAPVTAQNDTHNIIYLVARFV